MGRFLAILWKAALPILQTAAPEGEKNIILSTDRMKGKLMLHMGRRRSPIAYISPPNAAGNVTIITNRELKGLPLWCTTEVIDQIYGEARKNDAVN
eukprot:9934710-Alexandrium_andersonii.AAC.1